MKSMQSNLFSVFDPSSSYFSLSWIILLILPLGTVTHLWKSSSPMEKISSKITKTLFKEVSFTLKSPKYNEEAILIMVFVFILLANFIALYPQTFSATSHLTITMPLSCVTWLTIVMFGWTKNTKSMLSHLVPQGTPYALMSFMVLIELTSNMIRPITLCVRLTANLIAGHLLMTLLGNAVMTVSPMYLPMMEIAPLILTVLESAVAFIQAYVFMTLLTLYVTEVK